MNDRRQWAVPRPAVPLAELLIEALRRSHWLTRIVLVEVLVCCLLVVGAGKLARPRRLLRAVPDSDRTEMRALKRAAVARGAWGCPDIQELAGASPGDTRDRWGRSYQVRCDSGAPVIVSLGLDGIEGSKDDRRI